MSPVTHVLVGVALVSAAVGVWVWNWDPGPRRDLVKLWRGIEIETQSKPSGALGLLPARVVAILVGAAGIFVAVGSASEELASFQHRVFGVYHVFSHWKTVAEGALFTGFIALLLVLGTFFAVAEREPIEFILILVACCFGFGVLLVMWGYLGYGPLKGYY